MTLQKKSRSLRVGVLFIAVTCWVLPLLLVLTFLALDAANRDNRRFEEEASGLVNEIAQKLSSDMANLVAASRYATYDPAIISAYDDFMRDGDEGKLYDDIILFMNNRFKYDENISASLLYYTDLPKIYYTVNAAIPYSQTKISYYEEYVHSMVVKISEELGTDIAFYNSGDYLYMIRNIVNSDYEPRAVIIFRINDRALFSLFREISRLEKGIIYLNGTPFLLVNGNTPAREPVFSQLADIRAIPSGTHVFKPGGNNLLVDGHEKIDGVDILYSIGIDKQTLRKDISEFRRVSYWALLAFVPMFFICAHYFSLHIFNPINSLIKAAKKIEKGELGIRVGSIFPNKEFDFLAETFDAMSCQLKNQFDRIYSEELALRDAKIMTLQMQINPHFLNNTLEIINWEARLGNNAKVSRMIESLSVIMDATTSRNQAPLVPLHKELAYLDAYLYIIAERFAKQLTVKKSIDRSLLHLEVPCLIMQPIIENALEHGLPAEGHGNINITAEKSENALKLIVENNVPLDEESKERIEKCLSPDYSPANLGSLGIYNVNMRIKMIYGEGSGLEIISDNEKTLSIITILLQ